MLVAAFAADDETIAIEQPEIHLGVLDVEPRDGGGYVRVLELDQEGEFLDPWPGGFDTYSDDSPGATI